MRNRFLLGAGVALAVTLGGAAGAQAQFFALPSGPGAFYIGGEGGWTWLKTRRFTRPVRFPVRWRKK